MRARSAERSCQARGLLQLELDLIGVSSAARAPIKPAHHWRDGRAVQNDRDQNDQPHCAPEKIRILELAVVQAIGEVIRGPKAAYPEERDHSLFVCRLV